MGGNRARHRRALGLSDRELIYLIAVAESGSVSAAAQEIGVSDASIKQVLHRARQKAGTGSTLTLYHRLVRGIRFETHVTTRVVVEED